MPRLTFFKAGAITGVLGGALVLLVWHLAGRPVADFGLFGWVGERPALTAAVAVAWVLMSFSIFSAAAGDRQGGVITGATAI
jgi:hypothetical protein